MLTIRASKPAEFTQSALAPHDTVALHANQPEGFVSGMAVIALCCDPVCPSCGTIGRNQDGSVVGSALSLPALLQDFFGFIGHATVTPRCV